MDKDCFGKFNTSSKDCNNCDNSYLCRELYIVLLQARDTGCEYCRTNKDKLKALEYLFCPKCGSKLNQEVI